MGVRLAWQRISGLLELHVIDACLTENCTACAHTHPSLLLSLLVGYGSQLAAC